MPFLAPIVGAIGSAIATVSAWAAASPLLAGIVQTAFGIAAKFALNALFPPKSQSRASQLDTEYGGNIPRSVILGTVGTAGHHIYRNAYGSGNRNIEDVYVLSNFRITGVPRVRYNGKWRVLTEQDANGYWLVPNEGTSNDGHDNVRVKFYFGSMTQAADPLLVAHARPASRWTADHRGAGVAYAIVYSELRKQGDGLASPAKLFFEVQGAPLYDWRKDSSVGGSGTQRWADQSTWAYSDNPVVQIYNLERGFFNGTQRMVGKAALASRLPLSEYTQAANICDEVMSDGTKRYCAHAIAKDGPGSNHDANLTPILEAMCGTWVERVDGEYPIAGAPQAIVATITDNDLKKGAAVRFTAKRKRTELINTVAASYISPEEFYETATAATRIDAGALAEDGETLASAIPFSAVTDIKQVDRLADIAIRGARYQASAEITVHPKFLDTIKEGKWITWTSAKYGTNTFQVLSRQLGAHGTDGVRDITLNLQEISNGVFDPTAYTSNPPNIIVISPPAFLAEVQGFTVTPNLVSSDGIGELPGARLQWIAIDDISVTGIDVEYRPVNDTTNVFKRFVTADISVVQIVEGLTRNTDWQVRTRPRVDNGRAVAWSAWVAFHTLNTANYGIDIGDLPQQVQQWQELTAEAQRYIKDELERIGNLTSNQAAANFLDKQQLRREISATALGVTASYTEAINVAAGPGSALATRIETLEVKIPGLATVTALDALTTTVTTQGTQITSQGSAITSIQNELPNKASASSVTLLDNKVTVQGNDITANANAITALNTTVNGISANTTFRMQTVAAPSGWTARIEMQARVGTAGTFRSAGFLIDVTAAQARLALIADQIVMTDGTNLKRPFVYQGNVLYLDDVRVNAASIVNLTVEWAQIQNVNITSAQIGNLTVGTSNLDFSAVTDQRTVNGSISGQSGTGNPSYTLDTQTVVNPNPNPVLIDWEGSVTAVTDAGTNAWNIVWELLRGTTVLRTFTLPMGGGNAGVTKRDGGFYLDMNPVQGNNTYSIRVRRTGATISQSISASGIVKMLWWKR